MDTIVGNCPAHQQLATRRDPALSQAIGGGGLMLDIPVLIGLGISHIAPFRIGHLPKRKDCTLLEQDIRSKCATIPVR